MSTKPRIVRPRQRPTDTDTPPEVKLAIGVVTHMGEKMVQGISRDREAETGRPVDRPERSAFVTGYMLGVMTVYREILSLPDDARAVATEQLRSVVAQWMHHDAVLAAVDVDDKASPTLRTH